MIQPVEDDYSDQPELSAEACSMGCSDTRGRPESWDFFTDSREPRVKTLR